MGTGSIGEAVAGFLKPFGMHIRGLNFDGRAVNQFDQCYPATERLAFAQQLDYLLALRPDTTATDNAVDAALLAQLKPGATLINAGRGNSVNSGDVVSALNGGQLGFAVLDVLNEEPLPDDDPLWQVKNLHITSHTAAPSLSESIVGIFCDNYRRYHAGEVLHHLIDFEKGY
jgi:phosphoglycerate dehydrogenase-like enzyme